MNTFSSKAFMYKIFGVIFLTLLSLLIYNLIKVVLIKPDIDDRYTTMLQSFLDRDVPTRDLTEKITILEYVDTEKSAKNSAENIAELKSQLKSLNKKKWDTLFDFRSEFNERYLYYISIFILILIISLLCLVLSSVCTIYPLNRYFLLSGVVVFVIGIVNLITQLRIDMLDYKVYGLLIAFILLAICIFSLGYKNRK